MSGQKEDIEISDNGQLLLVNRGKKGAALVNISGIANFVNLPTNLPNGTYYDEVYGKEFKVKKGMLTGLAAPYKTYILKKK